MKVRQTGYFFNLLVSYIRPLAAIKELFKLHVLHLSNNQHVFILK